MTPATIAAVSALDVHREAARLQRRQWHAMERRVRATLRHARSSELYDADAALTRVRRCTTLYLALEQRVRALVGVLPCAFCTSPIPAGADVAVTDEGRTAHPICLREAVTLAEATCASDARDYHHARGDA